MGARTGSKGSSRSTGPCRLKENRGSARKRPLHTANTSHSLGRRLFSEPFEDASRKSRGTLKLLMPELLTHWTLGFPTRTSSRSSTRDRTSGWCRRTHAERTRSRLQCTERGRAAHRPEPRAGCSAWLSSEKSGLREDWNRKSRQITRKTPPCQAQRSPPGAPRSPGIAGRFPRTSPRIIG